MCSIFRKICTGILSPILTVSFFGSQTAFCVRTRRNSAGSSSSRDIQSRLSSSSTSRQRRLPTVYSVEWFLRVFGSDLGIQLFFDYVVQRLRRNISANTGNQSGTESVAGSYEEIALFEVLDSRGITPRIFRERYIVPHIIRDIVRHELNNNSTVSNISSNVNFFDGFSNNESNHR